LLLLTLLRPLTPAAAQSVTLHPELGQARAALHAGQPATAAALARRALDLNPTDLDAALLLGLSLEAEGRAEEAVAVLAAARHRAPSGEASGAAAAEVVAALRRLLPGALPERIEPALLGALPGAGPAGTVARIAFQVEAPEGPLTVPVTDPKYGWSFSRRAAVYIDGARRYSIYYQDAKDLDLARRVAGLLGRLHAAATVIGTPASEVRVWLPRAGHAGGEQYRDSVYLFAVDVARGDSEWVREVSHELGHIVLPSFARFDAPEPMENGYLGERLLPQALWELGERAVWDGRVPLADYLRLRAAPLRRRFLDAGPASPLRTDRSAAGMDYAIGLVLALEAQHGPEFLARVFRRTNGEGLESLLLAYRDEVAATGEYHIPAELVVPAASRTSGMLNGRLQFRRAAYRAYLPSGRWSLTMRGDRLDGVKVTVDGRRLSAASGREDEVRLPLVTDVSRWHLIQLEASAPGAGLAELAWRPAPVAAPDRGRNHPSAGRN
jgi:hypothetical protein